MGTIARGKLSHLIEDLLRNPSAYAAFQALHLIEANLGDEVVHGNDLQDLIHMAPAGEMTFPAGEIRRCLVDERDRYRLELNFMGFYGVDSPLPQFFNDITAFDTQRSAELRSFLELFNQRLYHLLYEAWKKMNLHTSSENRTSLYCRYLAALYGSRGAQHLPGRFDYAGLLASRVKNSQSLADMLKDHLHCPVNVRQNIPTWIPRENPCSLGGSMRLGDDALLGSRLLDVNSKLLLRIGPLSNCDATDILPGRRGAATLAHMIREYLEPTLQYDVEVLILPDENSATILGDGEAVLGGTACLGRPGKTVNRLRFTGESLDRMQYGAAGFPQHSARIAA